MARNGCAGRLWLIRLAILLIALALLPAAHAVGVAPASSEHSSMVGNTLLFRFKVLNPDGEPAEVTVSAEGELAQHLALSEQTVLFAEGETERWVSAELEVSDDFEPGLHQSRILVSSAPAGTGTFTATLQVQHRLSLHVGYPESYLKVGLAVPVFRPGEEGVFQLGMENKGRLAVEAGIDARVRDSGTSASESLPGPGLPLAVGQYSTIGLPWTPEWPGDYVFQAEISYANTSSSISEPFLAGTPLLTPEWAEIRRVALGEVLPVTLGIASNWNVPIEAVHAWAELWQNGTVLLRARTVSEDIAPRGHIELPIYIETAGLEYGTYRMEMDLISGRTRERYAFELTLSPERIRLTPTGFVITVKQETLSERIGKPWSLAAAAAVLAAAIVVVRLVKKKKKKNNR